jgi:hydroxypyruvate isomerase
MPQFAANLAMMYTERPFGDRFAAAAAGGFRAVECLFPFDHPPEAIAQRLHAMAGLAPVGVGHIQIASMPNRHEPPEGEVAYGHLFALLDALGYRGFVGCEYRPRASGPGGTTAGLGWFAPRRASQTGFI